MGPKKSDTPIQLGVPEQPPTFENDAFMEDLLHKAKTRDIAAVEAGVSAALCVEDYRVNIRHGILVDYLVECVLFSAQQNFSSKKAAVFIRWNNEMRHSIETSGGCENAKTIFKNLLTAHAERSAKDIAPAGCETPLPTADETPSTPPPQSKVVVTQKREGKRNVTKGDEATAARVTDNNAYFSLNDMGNVADFVVTGLLQHWRLYCYTATNKENVGDDSEAFTMNLQTVMRAPPLQRAVTQEVYEKQCDDRKRAAEQELERLRKAETEELERKRVELERISREKAQAEEEERANQLFFLHSGTEKCVQQLEVDLQKDVMHRQQQILDRIAKLEEALKLIPS